MNNKETIVYTRKIISIKINNKFVSAFESKCGTAWITYKDYLKFKKL